jgi:hypothetical protein
MKQKIHRNLIIHSLTTLQAEMEGRRQGMYALQALKAVVPGFEKAKLRNFGMTLGTRDSRKIIGEPLYISSPGTAARS